MQLNRDSRDDTYMYDDAIVTSSGMRMPHQGHWYDEPPYESDPDDFLMSGMRYAGGGGVGVGGAPGGPSATIQGSRVCYTSNGREGQGVISLRSAGDISIPQRGPVRRGLIVPQQPPNPPTIIPLKHARSHDRESGDYAGSISDLHSVTSRLSQVSNQTIKLLLSFNIFYIKMKSSTSTIKVIVTCHPKELRGYSAGLSANTIWKVVIAFFINLINDIIILNDGGEYLKTGCLSGTGKGG
ncbi:uncharacterized protein LOC129738256 [Uranotaenia lowii]|uniref:uncharacterized protein LOC129738256 n=1 Tax=Uranotaenia lowii TaxID=190385 RepID=UPI00247AE191|nr:uncharacterized protein LOC129738256 [Uranotaenia lowii]